MAVKPLLAVGCQGSAGISWPLVQKFDSAGNPYAHGHRQIPGANTYGIFGVALTTPGDLIAVASLVHYTDLAAQTAYGVDAQTAICYSPHGDVRWSKNHGAACFGVVADDDGNIYTFGDAINAYGQLRAAPTDSGTFATTRKYSPAGTLLWSADHGYASLHSANTYSRPIVYRDGYLYTGAIAFPYTKPLLTKTDAATGEVVWSVASEFNSYIMGIAVDGDGNVYAAGYFHNSGSLQCLRKYDPDGLLITGIPGPLNDYSERVPGRKVVLTSAGNIVIAMNPVVVGEEEYVLHEYDSDGIYVTRDTGDFWHWSVTGLAIDADDTLYLTRTRPSAGSGAAWRTVCNAVALEQGWQATTFATDVIDVIGNEVDPLCIALREVETPPLRLPVRLAVPSISGDSYVLAPALALRITLGVPLILREYLGSPLPEVWRLAFPDDPDLSLPLRSVQIRKVEAVTTLTLVVQIPDADTITALEALIDEDMTLLRGVRFPTGREQLEPMVTVAFTGLTADVGSSSASATITGSVTTTAPMLKTRRLRGISYRNSRDGLRRIRCAVDTYLEPGDTADLGDGETLTVGEVTIFADAERASMEVTE